MIAQGTPWYSYTCRIKRPGVIPAGHILETLTLPSELQGVLKSAVLNIYETACEGFDATALYIHQGHCYMMEHRRVAFWCVPSGSSAPACMTAPAMTGTAFLPWPALAAAAAAAAAKLRMLITNGLAGSRINGASANSAALRRMTVAAPSSWVSVSACSQEVHEPQSLQCTAASGTSTCDAVFSSERCIQAPALVAETSAGRTTSILSQQIPRSTIALLDPVDCITL